LAATRVLLAITVYNGRAFVPRAIRSAMRLSRDAADVDVLVLDDCSPEPGWSEELETLCRDLGAGYYRSPRNLGIVRNVNLGLRRALAGDYDHVIVSNSDVIYPADMVTQLLRVVATDPEIGSVTAWSNNVSAYSLPNDDPDRHLADQETVDWLTAALTEEFGVGAIDIPAGISFCVLIPTSVLRRVGLMDPVFGRGYCEETDWSLRSRGRGYRVVLAPSVFVYHAGRGSTTAEGMLPPGMTTVPAHEAIVNFRYPLFRSQVTAYLASDIPDTASRFARARIIRTAARRWGYGIDVAWLRRTRGDGRMVRCLVEPHGRRPLITAECMGFHIDIDPLGAPPGAAIRTFLGCDPRHINLYDPGPVAQLLVRDFEGSGSVVNEVVGYPARV
jgi:GT2 family glycosyltransferase